ncbi:MAG: hypothetical protein COA53_06920 [Rhodobacteraceae bacterium]|nr:MAG: hypothetical protein COA53_06920 [Paracoccaceae bacterium]
MACFACINIHWNKGAIFCEGDFAGRINQKKIQTTAALGELLMELLNAVSFAGAMILGGGAVMFSSDWLPCSGYVWLARVLYYCIAVGFSQDPQIG